MTETKWQTDVDGFRKAVENDEYAELVLPTGDVLITDWEGDGTYWPCVNPAERDPETWTKDEVECEIMNAIMDTLDVAVNDIEWDERNQVFVPYMERP